MHTYHLSDAVLNCYLKDFLGRLQKLRSEAPKRWLTLGISGERLGRELYKLARGGGSSEFQDITFLRLAFDRESKSVKIREARGALSEIPWLDEKPILLIDSAVHSGSSMRHVVDALRAKGATCVFSYTLVLKRTSEFIPTWFAMLIDEHDRAFFQLDRLPNNRLADKPPAGMLRLLQENDVKRAPDFVDCEVPSIKRVTFGDLWYEVRAHGQKVFLYEINGKVVGFVSFHVTDRGAMLLDIVARDTSTKEMKVGALLLRWAEAYARSSRCQAIDLWAHEPLVRHYQEIEYHPVVGMEPLLAGGGERYIRMRKRILYNVKPDGIDEIMNDVGVAN